MNEEDNNRIDSSTWMRSIIWISWAIRSAAWVRAINQVSDGAFGHSASGIYFLVLAVWLSVWSIESAWEYADGSIRCINPKLDLLADILVALYAAWQGVPAAAIGLAVIIYSKHRIYKRSAPGA